MAELRAQGLAYTSQAEANEAAGRLEVALRSYEHGIKCLLSSQLHERMEVIRIAMHTKIKLCLDRAEALKAAIAQQQQQQQHQVATPVVSPEAAASASKSSFSNQEQELREHIIAAALKEPPNVRWDQVAGLEPTKEALREAVIYPLKLPQLFSSGRLDSWSGILLYGPPGTGKTMLAKAVATEAGVRMFLQASVSKLMSKYVGESERLIAMLFKVAREHAPAVIFMDEADALASQRSDSDHEVSRKMKNCILEEMDGVGSGGDGSARVLVLAATNMPWMLDEAFMRRFQKKIYIPLPDTATRTSILQVLLAKAPNSLTTENIAYLAGATETYSGSDISDVVKTARNHGLTKLTQATHFRHVEAEAVASTSSVKDFALEPCSPGALDAQELSFADLESRDWLKCVRLPPVSMSDCVVALQLVKPSPSRRSAEEYEKFTQSCGQRGDGN